MNRPRKVGVCACGEHAFVATSKNRVTMTDVRDKELLEQRAWTLSDGYAVAAGAVKLHRLIIGASPGQIVDHINGDRLDNRRANLRFCTWGQNLQNKRKTGRGRAPLSPYKGVTYFSAQNKWAARITSDRKRVFLGYFDNDEDAAKAYDLAAKDMFGEFARTNF